jgi:hypothetical protein
MAGSVGRYRENALTPVAPDPSPPPVGAPAADVIAYPTKPPGIRSELLRAACVICFGYDLFLSHRRANRQYALRLWPQLEERGLITCFDATDFHLGQRLPLTMRRTVSDSAALLLLDTKEARESGQVRYEVEAALAYPRPVIEIREEGLGQNPWLGLAADGELLYEADPREAFDSGVPSEAVIEHIVSRHQAVRQADVVFADRVAPWPRPRRVRRLRGSGARVREAHRNRVRRHGTTHIDHS